MAVKTTLSNEDFTELLKHYNLDEYKDPAPIIQRAVQTKFILEIT